MSVLGLVGSIGSSLLGLGSSAISQKQQYKYQSQLQNEQYGYNSQLQAEQAALNEQAAISDYERTLDYWNKQNEYNLPENEVQRLKEAGLSPGLMYSGSAAGGSAASGTANTQAPTGLAQVGLGHAAPINYDMDMMSRVLDMQEQQANIQYLRSLTGRTDVETGNVESQTALNRVMVQNVSLRNEMQQLDNDLKALNFDSLSKMSKVQLENAYADCQLKLMQCVNVAWQAKREELGYKFDESTFDIGVALQEISYQSRVVDIAVNMAQIEAIRRGVTLTEAQIDQVRQTVENMPAIWQSEIGLREAQTGTERLRYSIGSESRSYSVLKNKYDALQSKRSYRMAPFELGLSYMKSIGTIVGGVALLGF